MKAKQQVLVVGGALLVVFICFVLSIWWGLYGRFMPAETTLRQELAALNLPAEFHQQSVEFRQGSCLDNCPSLGVLYKVDGTREHLGQILKERILARGYKVEYHAGHVWASTKDHIDINTQSEPGFKTGTRDYIFNFEQQNQHIDEVSVSLRYTP